MTWVDALLDATPVPPADASDEVLVAAAAGMVAARASVLARSRPAGGAEPAKIAELTSRQHAWGLALAAARGRLGAQRAADSKLRAYRTRQG